MIQPTITYLTPLAASFAVVLKRHGRACRRQLCPLLFRRDAVGAAASGLPVYSARGGWKSAGASLVTFYDLDGNLANGGFALVGGLSYSRMLGNIARSPIVAQRGSRNQFMMGGGVAYTFLADPPSF